MPIPFDRGCYGCVSPRQLPPYQPDGPYRRTLARLHRNRPCRSRSCRSISGSATAIRVRHRPRRPLPTECHQPRRTLTFRIAICIWTPRSRRMLRRAPSRRSCHRNRAHAIGAPHAARPARGGVAASPLIGRATRRSPAVPVSRRPALCPIRRRQARPRARASPDISPTLESGSNRLDRARFGPFRAAANRGDVVRGAGIGLSAASRRRMPRLGALSSRRALHRGAGDPRPRIDRLRSDREAA